MHLQMYATAFTACACTRYVGLVHSMLTYLLNSKYLAIDPTATFVLHVMWANIQGYWVIFRLFAACLYAYSYLAMIDICGYVCRVQLH